MVPKIVLCQSLKKEKTPGDDTRGACIPPARKVIGAMPAPSPGQTPRILETRGMQNAFCFLLRLLVTAHNRSAPTSHFSK